MVQPSMFSECRRIQNLPRDPNNMPDVAEFLRKWDDPFAERAAVRLIRSAHGNINTVGEAGVHPADDLDPHHPQWVDALEPGVKPLVLAVTGTWGCVTYDSCEGHAYTGLDLSATALRVGLLPRDPDEAASIAAALCRVVSDADAFIAPSCRIVIGRSHLTCERTGRRWSALDVYVEPAAVPGVTGRYFDDRLDACSALTSAVRGPLPQESRCAC